jgi:hypothetical protein
MGGGGESMFGHRRNRIRHAQRVTLFLAVVPILISSSPVFTPEPSPVLRDAQLNQQPVINEKAARQLIIPQVLPDSQVDLVIEDICAHIGLTCNFDVFPARVPNAMAYMIDGKRVVMYNPEFIEKVQHGKGQPSWETLSVLVHEIGHHLLGHMFVNDGNFPARELEADKFSGFLLYRMGATLKEAQANIRTMAQEKETSSHPGRSRRLVAVEQGWKAARTVALEETDLSAKRAVH